MSWDEKARELLKLKLWAVNKLEENPEQFKPEPPKDYKDGDILKVGNEEYTLKIGFKEKESSSAMTTGNVIEMAISSKIPPEKQKRQISTTQPQQAAGYVIRWVQENQQVLRAQNRCGSDSWSFNGKSYRPRGAG